MARAKKSPPRESMNPRAHKARHTMLHASLTKLLARHLKKWTMFDLMKWSSQNCSGKTHSLLDELVADFLAHNGGVPTSVKMKLPSNTTVKEFLDWSAKQAESPDSLDGLTK